MADVRYTSAKLGEAVQILATHPGRIKERLVEAVNRALHAVDPDVFSKKGMNAEARTFLRHIQEAITSAPQDPDRGVYERSIEALTEDQAQRVAQYIVSLDSMVGAFLEEPAD